IFGVGRDRLADRLAEHVAAVSGRRRIHDDVHGERDDRTRPLLRRTEQQVHRHGQAVIHLHLIDDGEIEFVENAGLYDMGGGRGGPQPSSAGGNSAAQPSAKVGIISTEKAEAWSLYTTMATSGFVLAIHSLDFSNPEKTRFQ